MEKKLRVGVLGATGMVGQRFISLLENHPWYEVVTVAASPRSAGKTYEEAVGGRWKMTTPMPEAVKKLVVMNVNEVEKVAASVDFVFSAVDMTKEEIKAIEEAYAKTETPVVSNNSAHRWTPDVPMVVPEINPEHFKVIEFQKKRLGTKRGFVAVKPNCSIQSYAPVLTAWKEFEPWRDRSGDRAEDHLPVHPCSGIKRTYCCCICKIPQETDQGRADRPSGKILRTSAGVKASERTEAVYPVLRGRQPSSGFLRCRL